MVDLKVTVGSVKMKNPLIAASGCFGFGEEAASWLDLDELGGICSKGLTLMPRLGNGTPRVVECASGMLNSVGLQNPGIEDFVWHYLPFMLRQDCANIINIAGFTTDDYVEMARELEPFPVDAIELNLSCPNVASGCMSIGSEPKLIAETVRAVKRVSSKPLWAKLTPNVTDITACAVAAEHAGADAVSLVNTFLGLAIDLEKRRPIMPNNTGGLSGPAIKPLALRMVADVYRAIDIPVVGMGGIMNGRDALEFICAGASAVQIGTANLVDPYAMIRIRDEMNALMEKMGVASVEELRGTLEYY